MYKSIKKIRPRRVFKKGKRYYVLINKRKVYISTKKHKFNKKEHCDHQIVRVVVNNLMAERKTRRRRAKKKQVVALEQATAMQPANGKSNSSDKPVEAPTMDLTTGAISGSSKQAPLDDALYTARNQAPQQLQLQDQPPQLMLQDRQDRRATTI